MNELTDQFNKLTIQSKKDTSKLSKLIDDYLIPTDNEKKKNAEISTPFNLRQEMLDKIPDEFWMKPRKVLEPCCGKGGFVVDVFNRFKKGGLEVKTILEECIYFCDINPLNIYITELLINPDKQYKLNKYTGDTLTMKFDVEFNLVVGNPPYQEVSETGVSKGGGNNLFTKFIYYADSVLINNGYILFINPPTYFSLGRSNNKNSMNLRKDILDNYHYCFINLEECSKHFNVGSKFIYYLIQKNDSKNNELTVVCKYNKQIYNTVLNQSLLIREYLPYLLTKECLNILDKVKNDNTDKLQIFHSPDNRSDKKHILKRLKNETDEDYKNRVTKLNFMYPIQATGSQVVYSSKKCKNQEDKKIILSRSGYLNPFYDSGIVGIGGDCFSHLVKDEVEANKIIKLLNCKLYKFYIETNKWSGFHHKKVLQDLPNIIDKVKEINDFEVYKYFDLSKKEIDLIEANI